MSRALRGLAVLFLMAGAVALSVTGCGGGGGGDSISTTAVNPAKPLIDTTYCGKLGQQNLNTARKAIRVFTHRIDQGDEVAANEKFLREAEEGREVDLEACAVQQEIIAVQQEARGGEPGSLEELESRCDEYNADEHAVFKALAESGNTRATLERLPEYRVVCAER